MSLSSADSESHSLPSLVEQATECFAARFGASPESIVAAPGRVNLIGEHVDYNDGFVLPMAIERYVVVAVGHSTDELHVATLYSANIDQTNRVRLDAVPKPQESTGDPQRDWSCYVQGVIAGFMKAGAEIPSFNAVIQSSVPLGGGLSSSAALEVAAATAIETLTHHELSPREKALLCQQAEHEFAGVPCGIMDQFASVFGQENELLLLDCRSQQIRAVPLASGDVTVLVVNSNVQHSLASGEYAKRRATCNAALHTLGLPTWRDATLERLASKRPVLSGLEYRRAKHVVTELSRAVEFAASLESGDWERVGQLMYASHASLRDDFEVSCHELDTLVDLARKIGVDGGVIGARMTGGGFGGSAVLLVSQDRAVQVAELIAAQYATLVNVKPAWFITRPARGAHVVS